MENWSKRMMIISGNITQPFVSKHRSMLIFTLVAVLWEGLLSTQGVSLYDEPWVMSAYYWIFRDPEACQYQMLYYNTLVLGGIWDKLFGEYGIIAFRIGGGIINILSCYAIYWALKPHVRRRILMLALYLFLLSFDYGLVVIHHNWITALITVVAVGFIDRALRYRNCPYIFIAGTILGVNTFTRLPNMALCGLAFVLVPYCYFTYRRTQDKTLTRQYAVHMLIGGVLGYALGVLINIILLTALGHSKLFFDNLAISLNIAESPDNSHSTYHMLRTYASNYWGILKHVFMLPLLPVLWWFDKLIYTLYAFFTIVLMYALYKNRNNESSIYIILMALLVAYLQPLGSDHGICNMGDNSDYLALALAVSVVCEVCVSLPRKEKFWVSGFFIIAMITYCGRMSYTIAHTCCDFDNGPRWKKTYKINSPLATTYTSKDNAGEINALLDALRQYVNKGDYLIAFDNPPGVNYFTETRPWIGNSWLLCYDSVTLEAKLCESEKNKPLPVIVTSKGTPTDFMADFKDWDNERTAENVYYFVPRKVELRHEFIKKHNYIVVWQNKHFIIWTPPRRETSRG